MKPRPNPLRLGCGPFCRSTLPRRTAKRGILVIASRRSTLHNLSAMRSIPPHPTLSDVAREAGVGTTTVSRVINGGELVSPETLARVRAAVDRLGFVPNHAARILKGKRTRTMGLVIPSIADSFFASCAEAAQAVARSHGSLLVVTTTSNDPVAEIESLRALTLHRIEGLMIAPADSTSVALGEFLHSANVPVVCFDRPIRHSSAPSVLTDNRKGARLAIEHLIHHGRRRILCLGGEPNLWTIHERLHGYRGALAAAGMEPLEEMSVIDHQSAESAIRRVLALPTPPDAIFATKNSATIYAFETLQRLQIQIPQEIALIGFDDFELAMTLGITVVEQAVEEVGRRAAELLFEQLNGAHNPTMQAGRRVKLTPRLVVRSSCGCSEVESL